MKNKVAIILGLVNAIVLGYLIYQTNFNKIEPIDHRFIEIESPQLIISHEIPDSMQFAGEEVPVYNQFTHEALDKELQINSYWHSSTLSLLKNAHRWFPIIEPILKENGIPEDFKYLALIESGLQNVVSPRGAAGFWQIMKKTGKEYGLEINKDVDERYHVEKATQVACDYLNKANKRFNDWTLSAAAYNAGQTRIKKELKKQKSDSYYELYLNTETARYIYRILAIKRIYENPEYYGFHLENSVLYPVMTYDLIEANNTIPDLISFAKQHDMDYKTFKAFNPWCRNSKLRNSRNKKYYFKTPDQEYRKLLER